MGCIPDYIKFTNFLCQQLSQNNLDSMKFLLKDLLSTRDIEGVGKPEDLFVLLEKRNELGDGNFRLPKDVLTQMKRQDLLRTLNPAKGLGNYDTETEDSGAQRERDCFTRAGG